MQFRFPGCNWKFVYSYIECKINAHFLPSSYLLESPTLDRSDKNETVGVISLVIGISSYTSSFS